MSALFVNKNKYLLQQNFTSVSGAYQYKLIHELISRQRSISIPPESARKPMIF